MRINRLLVQPDVQHYLRENLYTPISTFALKKSPFVGVSSRELTVQLQGLKFMFERKPEWLSIPLYYPEKIHLEQSTHPSIAEFIQSFIPNGIKGCDATCGWGMDAIHFHSKFKDYIAFETNPDLVEIVRYNVNEVFNLKFNIINQSIENELDKLNDLDFLYIDPDRRNAGKRSFRIEEHSPNLLSIQERFPKNAKIFIKLSPMTDVSEITKHIRSVQKIYLIAWKNDLKVMLLEISSKAEFEGIHCVNLQTNEPSVFFSTHDNASSIPFSAPKNFLYLPNAAVSKAAKWHQLAELYQVEKLHPNTSIFTSNEVKNFPGRVLKVVSHHKDLKNIKGKKFLLVSKNYPLSVTEISKKYCITEGGDRYLVFTKSIEGLHILECESV